MTFFSKKKKIVRRAASFCISATGGLPWREVALATSFGIGQVLFWLTYLKQTNKKKPSSHRHGVGGGRGLSIDPSAHHGCDSSMRHPDLTSWVLSSLSPCAIRARAWHVSVLFLKKIRWSPWRPDASLTHPRFCGHRAYRENLTCRYHGSSRAASLSIGVCNSKTSHLLPWV